MNFLPVDSGDEHALPTVPEQSSPEYNEGPSPEYREEDGESGADS